jgi:hypothetical protein
MERQYRAFTNMREKFNWGIQLNLINPAQRSQSGTPDVTTGLIG